MNFGLWFIMLKLCSVIIDVFKTVKVSLKEWPITEKATQKNYGGCVKFAFPLK